MARGGGSALLRAGPFISLLQDTADEVLSTGETRMGVASAHLEGEIKERAPVQTGHLRASYSHVVEKQGETVIGHVGTNVPYSIHQEFIGTAHIRPALDANEKKLITIMGEDTLTSALGHL